MKVLVTGGAGYIGSHTCKALAVAGYEPVVYDSLSKGHTRRLLDGAIYGRRDKFIQQPGVSGILCVSRG